MSIYDTGGADRFKWIRTLAASCSHVVVLCYDVHSKVSLVNAALLMEEVEPELTAQVVIVCGINRYGDNVAKEVHPKDAEAASVRCAASIEVSISDPSEMFSLSVQAVIDRIAQTSAAYLPVPTVLDVLLQ